VGRAGSARLGVAAGSVGSGAFLVETAVDDAEERETFGKPPIERQGISLPIAEVATDVERTRQLYRDAAWKADNGEEPCREVAMAKLSAATLERRAAEVALQVHGGTGYSRRQAIEERFRPSRGEAAHRGHRRDANADHRP
jgi:alkylation response protein AidB-like acyl-CoA dehydrogenase